MKKIIVIFFVIMIIGIGVLSGCNTTDLNKERVKFIGTWYSLGSDKKTIAYTWIFYENGTCSEIDRNGFYNNFTWNVKEGGKIDMVMPSTYKFSNNNNTLTISYGGDDLILYKSEQIT